MLFYGITQAEDGWCAVTILDSVAIEAQQTAHQDGVQVAPPVRDAAAVQTSRQAAGGFWPMKVTAGAWRHSGASAASWGGSSVEPDAVRFAA